MNILILEDNPSAMRGIVDMLEQFLIDSELRIFSCSNLYLANEAIFEVNSLDVIVADLNMSTAGLKNESIVRTHMGYLTGWVWIEDNILSNKKFEETNIIIFSEYINILKEMIGDKIDSYNNAKQKIVLMSKMGDGREDALTRLERLIKRMCSL